MSANIGTIGNGDDFVTVSVGDGGTVYLSDSARGEWFFGVPDALRLAELLERAARYYDPDPRTAAEQALGEVERLRAELEDRWRQTGAEEDPPW